MGWSWEDYQQAPEDLTDEIVRHIHAEYERSRKTSRGRGKLGGSIPDFSVRVDRDSVGRASVSAGVQATESKDEGVVAVDSKGREVVTKTLADGTVVTHRRKTPAEELIHSMYGPPKSWKNK